jgi:hypothetical protein
MTDGGFIWACTTDEALARLEALRPAPAAV